MNVLEKEIKEAYNILEMYAMFLTRNEEFADDLLQETLLRILSKSDKYEEEGNFNAWAKMVMKNIFLNERYNNERYRQKFVDGYSYINDEAYHPFVAESDCRYSREDIEEAISLLPTRYAQIITLQIDGYKYEEIAKLMNVSLSCVKNSIFSAKNRLKKLLNSLERNKFL